MQDANELTHAWAQAKVQALVVRCLRTEAKWLLLMARVMGRGR